MSSTTGEVADLQRAERWARYEEQERKRKALEPAAIAASKQALFAVLRTTGVARVEVTFDGYGDSGQLDEPIFTGVDDSLREMPVADVEICRARQDGSGVDAEIASLGTSIEALCYAQLRIHHVGWENGEGAFGDFVFDVGAETITYTHNERYTEVEAWVHEL
jgi:hypothetical protein